MAFTSFDDETEDTLDPSYGSIVFAVDEWGVETRMACPFKNHLPKFLATLAPKKSSVLRVKTILSCH